MLPGRSRAEAHLPRDPLSLLPPQPQSATSRAGGECCALINWQWVSTGRRPCLPAPAVAAGAAVTIRPAPWRPSAPAVFPTRMLHWWVPRLRMGHARGFAGRGGRPPAPPRAVPPSWCSMHARRGRSRAAECGLNRSAMAPCAAFTDGAQACDPSVSRQPATDRHTLIAVPPPWRAGRVAGRRHAPSHRAQLPQHHPDTGQEAIGAGG